MLDDHPTGRRGDLVDDILSSLDDFGDSSSHTPLSDNCDTPILSILAEDSGCGSDSDSESATSSSADQASVKDPEHDNADTWPDAIGRELESRRPPLFALRPSPLHRRPVVTPSKTHTRFSAVSTPTHVDRFLATQILHASPRDRLFSPTPSPSRHAGRVYHRSSLRSLGRLRALRDLSPASHDSSMTSPQGPTSLIRPSRRVNVGSMIQDARRSDEDTDLDVRIPTIAGDTSAQRSLVELSSHLANVVYHFADFFSKHHSSENLKTYQSALCKALDMHIRTPLYATVVKPDEKSKMHSTASQPILVKKHPALMHRRTPIVPFRYV